MDNLTVQFNNFKDEVVSTWIKEESLKLDLAVAALGLVCEAGETGDAIKKQIAQGHPFDGEKIIEELGDTLYYMVKVMDIYGINLSEIMDANRIKRAKRYPKGFDVKRSVDRGC